MTSFRKLSPVFLRKTRSTAVIQAYTALVDADGGADHDTIAAAELALTAPFVVRVRYSATAYAGATLTKSPAVWIFDPGVTIDTSELKIAGADIAVIMETGVDVQAAAINWDGADGYLEMRNGVDTDGLDFAGARMFATGGGWGSIMDGGSTRRGVDLTSDDPVLLNIGADTTTAGGGGNALVAAGFRSAVSGAKVIDSDAQGIRFISTGQPDGLAIGCTVLNCDNQGISSQTARNRILANYVVNDGTDGLDTGAGTGDDSVFVGNISKDSGGSPLEIDTDSENVVGVGNRLDGAVVDSSGTSTVDANDGTAF